ncbi:hypothetical protein [Chitinophaga rhizosphaerae]|uniref:hypothetical protein n=1 Tax=Chitinophaga rhizosphaerae TaxID=1864947 RepID=UPI0013E02FB1|nr:hypothetical protein [Chitinophaga rhizosphaerae]
MHTFTIDKAHQELCEFLGEKTLKHKPELIIEYYKAQIMKELNEKIRDAVEKLSPLRIA